MSSSAAARPQKPLVQRIGMPMMRILGSLCGGAVIALGIYSITLHHSSSLEDIGTVVNDIYRVGFGILIITAEMRATKLLKWFSFLTFFFGIG